MSLAASTLLGNEVSVSRALATLFGAAFACGLATSHWSGLLAGPVSYWLVAIVSNAAMGTGGRTWWHILPWNWIDSLGELSFYMLLPLTVCSSAGWVARRVIGSMVVSRRE